MNHQDAYQWLATHSRDGGIHLAPMWFVVTAGVPEMWTYRRSQKVRNLRRDPRASVLVEAGRSYLELRGLAMTGEVEVVEDPAEVARVGLALLRRYAETPGEPTAEERAYVLAQAAKRVLLRFHATGTTSWDHGKLS